VRTFLTTILTGLILACPLLCGVAEADHGAHHEEQAPASPGPAPAHCPESSDDCVCRGAVPSADVKVPGIDSIRLPFDGLAGLLARSPAHPLAHLTREGTPTGLAGWGDPGRVRAHLQVFRC